MKDHGNQRGSARLGAIFLLSVLGPMAVLAVLWALAAGVGQPGSARDAFMDLMVWVLMISGVVLIVEEAVLIAATWFRPRSRR